MSGALEFLATAFILILLIIAFSHMLNGTFITWAGSKFKAASE